MLARKTSFRFCCTRKKEWRRLRRCEEPLGERGTSLGLSGARVGGVGSGGMANWKGKREINGEYELARGVRTEEGILKLKLYLNKRRGNTERVGYVARVTALHLI